MTITCDLNTCYHSYIEAILSYKRYCHFVSKNCFWDHKQDLGKHMEEKCEIVPNMIWIAMKMWIYISYKNILYLKIEWNLYKKIKCFQFLSNNIKDIESERHWKGRNEWFITIRESQRLFEMTFKTFNEKKNQNVWHFTPHINDTTTVKSDYIWLLCIWRLYN